MWSNNYKHGGHVKLRGYVFQIQIVESVVQEIMLRNESVKLSDI
jgi:hypothetical protein